MFDVHAEVLKLMENSLLTNKVLKVSPEIYYLLNQKYLSRHHGKNHRSSLFGVPIETDNTLSSTQWIITEEKL